MKTPNKTRTAQCRQRKKERRLKKIELWAYPECEAAIREIAKKIVETWKPKPL
jgi:molybdopterin synthase catalytic subunit